jgi:hypothetical protein
MLPAPVTASPARRGRRAFGGAAVADREQLVALVTSVLPHDPDCPGGADCDCTRPARAARLVDDAIRDRDRREGHQ